MNRFINMSTLYKEASIMNISKILFQSALMAAAAAMLSTAGVASATTLASDSAANPAYASGFSGQNGGTGFGAWTVTFTPTGAAVGSGGGGGFISSTNAGITAPTPAFDIYVYPGTGGDTGLNTDITTATRSFNSALAAGQTFTTDLNLDNGQTNPALANTSPSTADSNMGFSLLDSSGKVLFSMTAFGGGEYWATDASGTFEPASGNILYNYHADDTFAFSLLNAAGNYSLTATGNIGAGTSATFTGSINMATGGPAQVQYFDNNGGNGSDVQWSTLSIASTPVPEPATLALFAGAGLALLFAGRRRALHRHAGL
jgi:hypothetical protein